MQIEAFDMDAWSDGQMQAKLWLCKAIESKYKDQAPLKIGIYGAWYGTLAFLLLLRERVQIKELYLLDIDGEALRIAKKLLAVWDFNRKLDIHYLQEDCTQTRFAQTQGPDLVINTSCEHFPNYDWFKNIPAGIEFAIQSTDMSHPTHINGVKSLDEFKQKLIGNKNFFHEDVLEIRYPHFQFSRYFLMGRKT